MTIKYAYDGPQIIAEYDANDTLLRKFVYGPGIDEPICLIDVADASARYFYHCDGLGSVVALCDVNNVPVERYAYDVFGRPTIRDANGVVLGQSAYGNPYLFTGRAYDAETALYYYRARYYDYFTGRFLQPDPTGYTDGLNLYTYCGNSPLNWVDPSGLLNIRRLLKGVAQCALGAAAVIAAGPVIAVSGGLGTAVGFASAVGGMYGWSAGIANIAMAVTDYEPPMEIPSTPAGVALLPAGEEWSRRGDVAWWLGTGNYSSGLGIAATSLRVANAYGEDLYGSEGLIDEVFQEYYEDLYGPVPGYEIPTDSAAGEGTTEKK